MAEKILNTRIALKVDTLEKWNASSIVLKKGELAIATTAITEATGATTPVTMIKVGEGDKTFSQLPWALHAKASDVLAACKTEDGLKAFVNGVIANAGIATNEALKTLSDKVTEAEGDIDDLEAAVALLNGNAETAGSVAKAIADAIAALKLDETYDAKGAAAAAQTAAIAAAKTETENQIKALNVDDTAVEGQYVSSVKEVEGKIVVSRAALPVDTLVEGSANGTVKFNGTDVAVHGLGSAAYTNSDAYDAAGSAEAAQTAAIAAAKTETEKQVKALADGAVATNTAAIATLNGEGEGSVKKAVADAKSALQQEIDAINNGESGVLATAKKYTDDEIDKVEASIKGITDDYLKSEDKTALQNLITAEEDRATGIESGLNNRITTIEEDYLTSEDKNDLQTQINTIMNNPDAEGAINSINEFTKYVEEHGEIAEGFRADINKNKDDIAALTTTVGENKTAADNAIKGINERLDAALGEGETSVASQISTAKQEAIDAAANDATTKANKALDDAKAYADQAELDAVATANSNTAEVLKSYYTKTEADAAFMDATETGAAIDTKIAELKLGETYEPVGAETRAKSYADGLIAGLDVTDAAVAGQYVSAVNEVDGKIEVSRETLPTYTLATGDNNGTVKFNGTEVAVKGLGSAAYKAEGDFATAAQGALAATALQAADITTGSANGTIAVKGTDVAVKGLGSAAYTESSAYATKDQGDKADSALQSIAVGTGLKISDKAENKQTIDIDETVVFVFNCGDSTTVI